MAFRLTESAWVLSTLLSGEHGYDGFNTDGYGLKN